MKRCIIDLHAGGGKTRITRERLTADLSLKKAGAETPFSDCAYVGKSGFKGDSRFPRLCTGAKLTQTKGLHMNPEVA
jgi:hypothetical protein